MRVRAFELRLIAAGLLAGWALTAVLVLLGYHPGGPIDLLVALAGGLPIIIAVAGVIWPPVARGERSFAAIVWLGLATLLVLIPSIVGILSQLLGRGPQTLLPSLEAAYPWLLALLGTSLFASLGIARRMLGETALRRRRLVRGLLLALSITAAIGLTVSAVAVANDLALRDQVVTSSRFGPTDPELDPPTCDTGVTAGRRARVEMSLAASVDGNSIGSIDVRGVRAAGDFRWLAYVATNRELGQHGSALVGGHGWELAPSRPWHTVATAQVQTPALDAAVLAYALRPGTADTAEEHGLAFFEGARARHCRAAIDGPTFEAAFPQAVWLVGDASLRHWRGSLDYWVFADGELGRASGFVSGDGGPIVRGGLQGRLTATMTATYRDGTYSVSVPRP